MGPVGKWVVFTVIAGLIPYGAVVYVNHRSTGRWSFPPSSELLFLSVIVFATVLGEVIESLEEKRRAPGYRTYYLVGMLGGLGLSAFLYGSYVRDSVESPGRRAGVDCAALVEYQSGEASDTSRPALWIEADSVRGSLARRWGRECQEWHEAQNRAFRESLWLALWATVLGWLGMLAYGPPMKRRDL